MVLVASDSAPVYGARRLTAMLAGLLAVIAPARREAAEAFVQGVIHGVAGSWRILEWNGILFSD